jgi:hypothetical protein
LKELKSWMTKLSLPIYQTPIHSAIDQNKQHRFKKRKGCNLFLNYYNSTPQTKGISAVNPGKPVNKSSPKTVI